MLHFSRIFALFSRLVSVDARRASCVQRSSLLPAPSSASPPLSPLPCSRSACTPSARPSLSARRPLLRSSRFLSVCSTCSFAHPSPHPLRALALLSLSRPSRRPCACLRLVLLLPPTAPPHAALLSFHFTLAPCLHWPRSCVLLRAPRRCSLSSSRCAPLRPPAVAPLSRLRAPCSLPLLVRRSFPHPRAPSLSSPSIAAPPLRTARLRVLALRARPSPACSSLSAPSSSRPLARVLRSFLLASSTSASACPRPSLSLSAPVAARSARRRCSSPRSPALAAAGCLSAPSLCAAPSVALALRLCTLLLLPPSCSSAVLCFLCTYARRRSCHHACPSAPPLQQPRPPLACPGSDPCLCSVLARSLSVL